MIIISYILLFALSLCIFHGLFWIAVGKGPFKLIGVSIMRIVKHLMWEMGLIDLVWFNCEMVQKSDRAIIPIKWTLHIVETNLETGEETFDGKRSVSGMGSYTHNYEGWKKPPSGQIKKTMFKSGKAQAAKVARAMCLSESNDAKAQTANQQQGGLIGMNGVYPSSQANHSGTYLEQITAQEAAYVRAMAKYNDYMKKKGSK